MNQAPHQATGAGAPVHYEHAGESPFVDAAEFREVLAYAPTAVTIIATDGPAGKAGVTCSAVCSVSDAPPTILFCVNRRSAANSVIKANGLLSVNWLSAHQAGISQVFAGIGQLPMLERFSDTRWQESAHGIPYRTDALVALDCRIASAMEIGTHSVFVARVLNARRTSGVEPLVYCRRAYATTRPTQS
ncbi:flavin reductase [Paraburkholderia sp. EG286B]|uniref:flavin reductase n=1 Tax=Paraburkholderia sp. EG286B TaxID=3237011 RepID=UPI0034D38E21